MRLTHLPARLGLLALVSCIASPAELAPSAPGADAEVDDPTLAACFGRCEPIEEWPPREPLDPFHDFTEELFEEIMEELWTQRNPPLPPTASAPVTSSCRVEEVTRACLQRPATFASVAAAGGLAGAACVQAVTPMAFATAGPSLGGSLVASYATCGLVTVGGALAGGAASVATCTAIRLRSCGNDAYAPPSPPTDRFHYEVDVPQEVRVRIRQRLQSGDRVFVTDQPTEAAALMDELAPDAPIPFVMDGAPGNRGRIALGVGDGSRYRDGRPVPGTLRRAGSHADLASGLRQQYPNTSETAQLYGGVILRRDGGVAEVRYTSGQVNTSGDLYRPSASDPAMSLPATSRVTHRSLRSVVDAVLETGLGGMRIRSGSALMVLALPGLWGSDGYDPVCRDLYECLGAEGGEACFSRCSGGACAGLLACGRASGGEACFTRRCNRAPAVCDAAMACWRGGGGAACFRRCR